MTTVEVDYSVNLRDVNNGILEEYDVHLDNLLLVIVGFQPFVQELSHFVKVVGRVGFFVAFLLLKEVNENCIVAILGQTMLLIAHLEVLLKLLVELILKFVLVLGVHKSIIKDTKHFMAPHFYNLFLLFDEVFVSKV